MICLYSYCFQDSSKTKEQNNYLYTEHVNPRGQFCLCQVPGVSVSDV